VLDQFLHSSSTGVASITAWPQLKDMFIRLNTPLSASFAVERLFSCAGMIMNDRRTRLNDKNFENLVCLKVNSWTETKQNEVLIELLTYSVIMTLFNG
jgi:hypothetical protein